MALNFCTCQSGYVNTQQDSPSSCETCGVGYFCQGGMHRQQCLPSQTTEADTAGNVSQCLCSSGAFLGAEACEPCAAGRYKSSIGNDACEKCAAGKWSNTTGAVDAATCVNCITGSTTEADGSAGEESCVRPENGQVAACISGRVCLIDPLFGFGLRSGHRIVITASDCASAKLAVARVSDNGMSKPSMNGRQYIWGNVPGDFLPAGGSYNLCWCAGMGALSCADIRINFWLAAGQLEVAGPLENSFECVRGEDCVDLGPFQGYGLSESDKVAARRGQCGGQQSLALSTAPAHLNGVGQLKAATDGSFPFFHSWALAHQARKKGKTSASLLTQMRASCSAGVVMLTVLALATVLRHMPYPLGPCESLGLGQIRRAPAPLGNPALFRCKGLDFSRWIA